MVRGSWEIFKRRLLSGRENWDVWSIHRERELIPKHVKESRSDVLAREPDLMGVCCGGSQVRVCCSLMHRMLLHAVSVEKQTSTKVN